jgi:hypothetical protein
MPGDSGPLALPELVLGLEIDTRAVARAQGLLDASWRGASAGHWLPTPSTSRSSPASLASRRPSPSPSSSPPAPIAGRLLDYAVHLRERGRAQATVNRRLGTLRALLRMAVDLGLLDGAISMPSENQIRAATEEPPTESPHYLFPHHPGESYRLDVQHYALWQTLRANFLAPVEEPSLVLDVGCGTGRWGLEVCGQFPGTLVVGLGLVAGESERRLSRYRFVKGDVLRGLPFADGRFGPVG